MVVTLMCFLQRRKKQIVQACSVINRESNKLLSIHTQGCGCYSMLSQRSNLIIDHCIEIHHDNWTGHIHQYSSMQFSRLYQDGAFPSIIQHNALELTDAYWNLVDCIESVIEYINENSGFTVFGCYKCGVINDKSIMNVNTNNHVNGNNANNPDVQVDNGDTGINFHPCFIQPTDHALLKLNDPKGIIMSEKNTRSRH